MKFSFNQTALIAVATALAAFTTGNAQAEYPEKEITMIVNAGAGGSTSAGARILAKAMEKSLGKPVIVVSKPGGGGTKGALLVKKAAADGYTIGYTFSHNIGFAPQYKRKKALYTASSFDYLGSITDPRNSLVTLAGRGWTDLTGMIKKLKADGQPLRLVYSGGPGRLIGTAIKRDFSIDVKIIRVRGGGKSMQRVLGSHVDVVFTGGAHAPYTAAGQTIVIASIDEQRNPDFPKVPTYKEMGGGASTTTLQIVYAPKGLPSGVKNKLADAITAASKDESIIKLFVKNLKMRVLNVRDSALTSYMAKEQEIYTDLIKKYDEKDMKKGK
jgi:tripartite-type tricarboxylate transporter receptor subunit TctC